MRSFVACELVGGLLDEGNARVEFADALHEQRDVRLRGPLCVLEDFWVAEVGESDDVVVEVSALDLVGDELFGELLAHASIIL